MVNDELYIQKNQQFALKNTKKNLQFSILFKNIKNKRKKQKLQSLVLILNISIFATYNSPVN